MRPAALALAAVLAAAAPAPAAAEGPDGIGFAQAEEGTWWCSGPEAGEVLACARDLCIAESGGQDCHATRWCFPAGWSGLMVVWLPEFHATHVLCGMPGEDAMIAAFRAVCGSSPEFSRCNLVLAIDPDGVETGLEESIEPHAATAE